MIHVIAVLAGGVGAVARHLVTVAVERRADAPSAWGTATVNVSGAIGLGIVAGLVGAERLDPDVLLVVGGGFLGAYTTFSTWMVETARLAQGGPARTTGVAEAAANVLGPLVVGLASAAAGYVAGGLLVGGLLGGGLLGGAS